MSERADNHAAAKRDEDLGYLSTYISTEAGATGQSNADVLGRLVTDAHARLAVLEQRVEVIEADLQTANLPRLPDGVTRTLEQRITLLEKGVDGIGS